MELYIKKSPRLRPRFAKCFFYMVSCGCRALAGLLLAGCLREGKVDQRIFKLISGSRCELSPGSRRDYHQGPLGANGAEEQAVSKESIGGDATLN